MPKALQCHSAKCGTKIFGHQPAVQFAETSVSAIRDNIIMEQYIITAFSTKTLADLNVGIRSQPLLHCELHPVQVNQMFGYPEAPQRCVSLNSMLNTHYQM